ncbi:ADP-ribose pyrophosphatase, mitochondrial isoform X2 [Lucilia cuprina]|uniref:ADP-ribose pyrophosphatase, mitochondrial isoform X2 n=1 Tax=Lucilia cuprina TaxID=7375 RepID=UPI001F0706F1|nr:ADP-ribose pyrophosphatase, mitochondrial isoform X2 [Lucilia cuprina]
MAKASSLTGTILNRTCRNNNYPKSDVKRFPVPDEYLKWCVSYNDYKPPTYTAPHITTQVWADPDINDANFKPKWNQIDGNVNRVSFNGTYEIDSNGCPVNPIGRTGLRGRGLLGRWGPNHAADPIVTRWKRDTEGNIVKSAQSDKNILQMVAIQRHDNKMWAIPGGMVDPGEKVSTTLKREFIEEALDCSDEKLKIEQFFAQGTEVYKGYVDDFRNTDNAWMETVAYNFHDDSGSQIGKIQLTAGDDAASVRWLDLDKNLELHANHIDILKKVIDMLKAHW